MNRKTDRIQNHYSRRVSAGREAFDILDWSSSEAQRIRFQILVEAMGRKLEDRAQPSLLDVGCGLTDLATFLRDRLPRVHYVGVDITWPILSEARRRHPRRDVLQADVFARHPFNARSFDVAFCSGIFNLRLGNNQAFAAAAVRKLSAIVNELVVANFLHIRTRRKYPHCFYFDPERIREDVADAAREFEIIDNYLDNDFTVVMRPSRTPG